MAGNHDAIMDCPFCGYRTSDVSANQQEYAMLLHMETNHPEGGQSSFVPDAGFSDLRTAGNDSEHDEYVECPVDACNEVVVRDELDYHLELHAEEADTSSVVNSQEAVDDSSHHLQKEALSKYDKEPTTLSPSPSTQGAAREARGNHRESRRENRQQSAITAWRNLLAMPTKKRHAHDSDKTETSTSISSSGNKVPWKKLGKAELGKYANEDQMPQWLVDMLKKNGQEVGQGVVPVLEQLLGQSPTTKYAYLCHPSVQHISKLRREGGFCGYRNIQMLASYVNGVEHEGLHHFKGKLPSIFDIQEFIETAWDRGINKQGRLETGGIRGTRKYIGTPEAQALFVSLAIPCEAQGFKNKEAGKSEELLLQSIERYFQGCIFNPADKVRCTDLPPIYFQHAGHSMTIIGIEKLKSGGTNLLVFDPMFHDSSSVMKLVGKRFENRFPDQILKPYRRGQKYLGKYREFEVLRLKTPLHALESN